MKSLVFLLCFVQLHFLNSEAANCDIEVSKDVSDTIIPITGPCTDKSVTVSLTNEYRAYCAGGSGHCESTHRGYHPGSRLESYRHCIPIAKKFTVNNVDTYKYSTIEHKNVPVTCNGGATQTTVDIHYVNATRCHCKILMPQYPITV